MMEYLTDEIFDMARPARSSVTRPTRCDDDRHLVDGHHQPSHRSEADQNHCRRNWTEPRMPHRPGKMACWTDRLPVPAPWLEERTKAIRVRFREDVQRNDP